MASCTTKPSLQPNRNPCCNYEVSLLHLLFPSPPEAFLHDPLSHPCAVFRAGVGRRGKPYDSLLYAPGVFDCDVVLITGSGSRRTAPSLPFPSFPPFLPPASSVTLPYSAYLRLAFRIRLASFAVLVVRTLATATVFVDSRCYLSDLKDSESTLATAVNNQQGTL